MIALCTEKLAERMERYGSNPSECAIYKKPAFMAVFLYLPYDEMRTFRSTSYPHGITRIKPQRGAAPKG